eukprot:GDKI01046770.1.p1 GENE.GDKI01046770.1~~GDKI01046770.1.p1  ORF type:complete len:281 (-),score=64.40 GDKI01046770.1:342-1091(-)
MHTQREFNVVGRGNPFEDVHVSLPLPPELFRSGIGSGQEVKAIVAPHFLTRTHTNAHRKCVVYGAGIAGDSTFEQDMVWTYGCEVHAFDCTLSPNSPSVKNMPFIFHQVCIGTKPPNMTEASNTYANYEGGVDTQQLVFKPLAEVMSELNHTHVDVLKFDIEGSEWQLIEEDILRGTQNKPEQLLFELHTHYANPHWVPHSLVHGKQKPQVNQLFIDLFDAGYRVVSKETNDGDFFCAEFSLIRTEVLE